MTLSYGVQIFFKASEFPQAVSALIAYDMAQRAQEAYNQIVTLNGLDTMYKGITDDQ